MSASEIAEAIGRVTIAGTAFEEHVRDAVVLAAGVDGNPSGLSVVNVLTTRMPYQTLLRKFGAICKQVGAPEHEQVHEFVNAAIKAGEERNKYVHSAFVATPDREPTQMSRNASHKRGFEITTKKVTVEEITELAGRFRSLEAKLWEYVP